MKKTQDTISSATIRELRTALTFTQAMFARLLGLRLRAYWSWETKGLPQDRRRRHGPFQILQTLLALRSVLILEDGTLSEFARNIFENEGEASPEEFLPGRMLLSIGKFADRAEVNAAGELFEALRPGLYKDISRWIVGSLFFLGIPAAFADKRLDRLKKLGQEFTDEIWRALQGADLLEFKTEEALEVIEKQLDEAGKARLQKLLENPKEVIFSGPESLQLAYLRGSCSPFQRETGKLVANLPDVGPDLVHGILAEVFSVYLRDGWPPEGEGG